jgi:hypothetical protein
LHNRPILRRKATLCDNERGEGLRLRGRRSLRPQSDDGRGCGGRNPLRRRACDLIALGAIQILGGNGYTNDYPLGHLVRDATLYEIGAGTGEIRRMLIGRELFQKSA